MSLFRQDARLPARQPEIGICFPDHDLAIRTNAVVHSSEIQPESAHRLHEVGAPENPAIEILLVRFDQLIQQMPMLSKPTRDRPVVAGLTRKQ